jgi:DNA-binding response OmpR family regulator
MPSVAVVPLSERLIYVFTRSEVRLMRRLLRNQGEWVSLPALARALYGDWHDDRLMPQEAIAVRTHVWRIRTKLPPPWEIETRYGHGLYRLVGA